MIYCQVIFAMSQRTVYMFWSSGNPSELIKMKRGVDWDMMIITFKLARMAMKKFM